MDGYNERNSVVLVSQYPAEMSVPGVAMHNVGVDIGSVEINASPHRAESGAQWLWTGEVARIHFKADDLEIAFFKTLVAKATHFHRHHFRQFAREIVRMHTRPTVDAGRILVGEEENLHVGFYVVGAALVSSAESAERAFAAAHASGFTLPGRGAPAHQPRAGPCPRSRRKEYR